MNQGESSRVKNVSRRNRRIGTLWLAAPLVGLTLTLAVWGIASAAFPSMPEGAVGATEPIGVTVSMWINIVLGFIGVLCFLGMLVGIPVGIMYLNRREVEEGDHDPRSGKGYASEVPLEIIGWNWGAAGLGMIWAAYHRVWKVFYGFIPLVGLIWWVVMGINGSRWAWQQNRWISVEDFQRSQRRWKPWGIVFLVLHLCLTSVVIYSSASDSSNRESNGQIGSANLQGGITASGELSGEALAELLAVEQRPQKFYWLTYAPPTEGFTAAFPTEPESDATPGDGELIQRTSYYVSKPLGDEGDVYLLIDQLLVQVPDQGEEDEMLVGMVKGFMEAADGYELLTSDPAQVESGAARDFLATDNFGSYIQGRVVLKGEHAYSLLVYNDQADRANYMKFLDSLRITQ